MFAGHDESVFALLTERRVVDSTTLAHAMDEHRRSGQSFTSALLGTGVVAKETVLAAVAAHFDADFISALPDRLPDDTVGVIDGNLARTYGVAPWARDDTGVNFLALDPFNPHLVNDLTFALDRNVRLTVADPDGIAALIERHYGSTSCDADGLVGEPGFPPDTPEIPEGEISTAELEQLAGQTSIVRFVNLILSQAIRDRASDIHFEPFEHEFKIRYRIDGALHEMTPPPQALALPVISRVKVLANLNIAERRVPQDGRIKLALAGRPVDLRVSTLPTQFGESVVLRVLDQSAVQLDLTETGMPAAIEREVRRIIRRPHGMLVVTGPTGSGKTTTLYSCLKVLNAPGAKLLTVEDPVEYEIDGIMQVPVNLAAGLTFARSLRAFLRQDPDIVMVGEIRDLETAQIAIQASLTGHLVLSTLHTNDAASAVTRLVDMGIEPFLLASTLEAVLAQRLVRRLCPECRVSFEPSPAVLEQIEGDTTLLRGRRIFSARGCPACHHTGYRGRLGIFELLTVDDALRDLIVAGASLVDLRRGAVNRGSESLRAAGLRAVLAGETTLEELVRHT